MMGVRLEDPESIEGNIPAIPGLGLLPQCTVIEQEKITRQSDFAFLPSSENKDCKDTKYIWDEPPYWVTPPNSP